MFRFLRNYKIELFLLFISVVVIFQFIPIFEREEPFFIEESDLTNIESLQNDLYGFEVISDRLNRTLPWAMFTSGYKPSSTELIFGHGTGAYLNILLNLLKGALHQGLIQCCCRWLINLD